MKKNLLRITFFYFSLFLLCPSTIIAQVPCTFRDDWTEKDLINAEITWEWLSQPGRRYQRKLLEDGKYLWKFPEDSQWQGHSNKGNWELKGNILKMESYSIELNEFMIGKIGVTSSGSKWIVKEFKTPNRNKQRFLLAHIKCLVEQKINKWQQKGEFEKLASFK